MSAGAGAQAAPGQPARAGASSFISYSRRDAEVIRRLHAALEERGREAWVDWADIYPSAEWWEEIRRAIEGSDAMIFAISPASIESGVCLRELDAAIAAGKRLIPVVLHRVPIERVPESLGRHQFISFEEGEPFDASIARLIEALEADFEWMRDHTRLLLRATEWDAAGRDASRLLRGRDLDASEHWIARAAEHSHPNPTPLQADYILASRLAATRGQRRTIAGLAVVGVAILALAVVAVLQRGEAERQAVVAAGERDIAQEQRALAEERALVARSRELAAAAEQQRGLDPELALMLSLEALDVANTGEAETSLRNAIEASRVRAVLPAEAASTPVEDLAWAPDGRWIVGRHEDGSVTAWDQTVDEIRGVATGLHGVDSIVVPGRGMVLGLASKANAGLTAVRLDGNGAVETVPAPWAAGRGWSDAGPRYVGSSRDGSVILVRDGHRVALVGLPSLAVQATIETLPETAANLRLSPDGGVVAFSTATGVEVRSLSTGAVLSSSRIEGSIVDVEFTVDGRSLLVRTPSEATFWDVETGASAGYLELGGDPSRNSADLIIDPTNRYVGAGTFGHLRGGVLGFDTGGRVRVWSLDTGQVVSLVGNSTQPVELLSFLPDGDRFITVGTETVQIWDVRTSVELAALRGHVGQVVSVAVAPDGRQVATVDQVGRIRVWDADTDELVERLGRFPISTDRPDSAFPILQLDQSRDGRLVAFDVASRRVLVWDSVAGAFDDVANDRPVSALSLGTDGSILVTAEALSAEAGLPGTVIRFWRTDSGLAPRSCRVADATDDPSGIDLAPDGTALAIVTGDAWRIIRSGAGCETIRSVPVDGQFRALVARFAPDGRVVYTTGRPGFVEAWDAATGEPRWSTAGHQFGAIDLAVSPDGRLVATAGLDDVVRVWNAADGTPVHELRGHGNQVRTVVFSPDGTRIVSGGADRTAFVWDAASGALLDRLSGNTDEVSRVAVAADGRIVTAGLDGYFRVFQCQLCVPPAELQELGRSRVTRELTPEERRLFLRGAPG